MVESLNIWGSTVSDWRITPMHFVFGILLMAQLSLPPGATPPQVMTASFKPVAVLKAGQKADIAVSFNVIKPYAINRTPQISLKLTEVSGVKLAKTEITASSVDPKGRDEYLWICRRSILWRLRQNRASMKCPAN